MLRLVMRILWPSFLAAIAAEGLFFSLFDPLDLLSLLDQHDLPATAVYTLGFFFFWVFCSLAAMLSYYITQVPRDPHPPF